MRRGGAEEGIRPAEEGRRLAEEEQRRDKD
jgi:hypothetical protein